MWRAAEGGGSLQGEGRAGRAGGLWAQGRLCVWGRRVARLCPCRGSSGVQNGLLVVNMLMDGHRGLAEQLASCDLLAVLQSCWRDGQSSGRPQAVLALSAINRLAEHRLPLGPQAAGTALPSLPVPRRRGCHRRGRLARQGRAPQGVLCVSERPGWAHVSLSRQAERSHWTRRACSCCWVAWTTASCPRRWWWPWSGSSAAKALLPLARWPSCCRTTAASGCCCAAWSCWGQRRL